MYVCNVRNILVDDMINLHEVIEIKLILRDCFKNSFNANTTCLLYFCYLITTQLATTMRLDTRQIHIKNKLCCTIMIFDDEIHNICYVLEMV